MYSWDINSSYPSVLANKVPYRLSKHGYGNLLYDKQNQAKLMKIKVCYRVKYGFPSLFSNKNFMNSSCNFRYSNENAGGDIEYVWVEELECLKKLANISKLIILESWVFDLSADLYSNYVNKYYKFKSTMKTVSPLIYIASKLLLNSPYGKLGENLFRQHETISIFYFNKNNEFKIEHVVDENYCPEETNGRPIFSAAYITAMGRSKLLTGIIEVINAGGTYLYCDTDSIYFTCDNFKVRKSDHKAFVNNKICDSIKIDSTILGEWDCEVGNIESEDNEFIYYSPEKAGKYLNPKRYQIYTTTGKTKTKCAGFTKESQKKMNEDNFKFGNSFISRQKISTEYGTDIVDKQKVMSYPENLYYCYNYERKVYETISSNRIIGKGYDIIKNAYLIPLRKLCNSKYNVILCSHEKEVIIKDRIGRETTVFKPNIGDTIATKISGMVEMTARLSSESVVDENGQQHDERRLFFGAASDIYTGNKIKGLDVDYIVMSETEGYNTLIKAIKHETKKEVKEPKKEETKKDDMMVVARKKDN